MNSLSAPGGDLLFGASALLPTACTALTGPANVDGRCILGGGGHHSCSAGQQSLGTERCGAGIPVYVMSNVPYTSGHVAGRSYAALANIYANTRLNEDWATNRSARRIPRAHPALLNVKRQCEDI